MRRISGCPNGANHLVVEEAQEAADSSRLIPPYNADANVPAEVYSLHDIIPEPEFNALSVSQLGSASSHAERARLLPFPRSNWVNQHLALVYEAPKPSKRSAYVPSSSYPRNTLIGT